MWATCISRFKGLGIHISNTENVTATQRFLHWHYFVGPRGKDSLIIITVYDVK